MADGVWSLYGKSIAGTQTSVDLTPFVWKGSIGVWSPKTDGPGPAREGGGSSNNGQERAFYVGGLDATFNDTNDVSELNTSSFAWVSKTDYPVLRNATQLEIVSGESGQLSVGGSIFGGASQNEAYFHSISTDLWCGKTAPGTTGHFVHCGASPSGDDKIYCFSGNGWSTTHKAWDYSTDIWHSKANALADAGQGNPWTSVTYVHHSSNSINSRYSPGGNTWTPRASLSGFADSGGAANADNAYGVVFGGGSGSTSSSKIDDTTNTIHALSVLPEPRTYVGGSEDSPAVITYWESDPNVVDPFDTLDPVVDTPHLQSGSGHGPAPGYTPQGGITSQLSLTLYSDYDTITETHPDSTQFNLNEDRAGASDFYTDSDTDLNDVTNPAPNAFTIPTLTGADQLTTTIIHYDKYGLQSDSISATYFVKPYTPLAPTVADYNEPADQVDVTVNANAAEHAAVKFAIQCTVGEVADVSKYVSAAGALQAGAVYQTVATWGTVTVQLTGGGPANSVGFKTISQNYYNAATLSDLGPEATLNTAAPVVVGAHIQTNGQGQGSGDGWAEAGGALAGVSTIESDYNSITESFPDFTDFDLAIDRAGVDDEYTDNQEDLDDTTNPAVQQHTGFTGAAINGADRITITVTHTDKSAQEGSDVSSYYFVTPYTPQAPTVANFQPLPTPRIDVTVNAHAAEDAAVLHAIEVTTGEVADVGKYVDTDGTLTASPVYQTEAAWATITVLVTGDGPANEIGFITFSQNYYDGAVLSSDSPEA